MENNTQSNLLTSADALTIVELEARFEMTAAAVDTDKCSDNNVTVKVAAVAA